MKALIGVVMMCTAISATGCNNKAPHELLDECSKYASRAEGAMVLRMVGGVSFAETVSDDAVKSDDELLSLMIKAYSFNKSGNGDIDAISSEFSLVEFNRCMKGVK